MTIMNSVMHSDYYESPFVKYLQFIKSMPEGGISTEWSSPSAFSSDEEVLPTLRPPELLVGDDPNLDLRISIVTINLTESPVKVELDVWPLSTWQEILLFLIKGLILGTVIITSVLGNLLVIVSVARYHKLRVLTNYFVVSMAFADMLVALMAMVFNASVQLSGRWIFGSIMCDIWNSMDVYFSTVSILHLCCISIDRYLAIVQPLDYPLRMTRRTVACMLAVAWVSPVSISAVPIFLGWYTTQEQLYLMASDPGLCNFKVNLVYALVSSSMSFWIPGIIMLVMYYRIYREADRQEMMVFRSTVAALLLNKHLHINGMARGSVKITDNSKVSKNGVSGPDETASGPEPPLDNLRPKGPGDLPSDESTPSHSPVATPQTKRSKLGSKLRFMGVGVRRKSSSEGKKGLEVGRPVNGEQGTLDAAKQEGLVITEENVKKKQSPLNKMKRERKAAKTLGIIVSVFLLCWLPFFTWYLVSSLCGDSCESPELLVTVLFWIGYFNSTLNPIIYAYFNRDFRKAFRKTLQHYYGVCGCKRIAKLCKKCCKCGSTCNSCGACKRVLKCALICPRVLREDTPSSEVPPRSGISSDYVHIEMMRVEQEDP